MLINFCFHYLSITSSQNCTYLGKILTFFEMFIGEYLHNSITNAKSLATICCINNKNVTYTIYISTITEIVNRLLQSIK